MERCMDGAIIKDTPVPRWWWGTPKIQNLSQGKNAVHA